jgi:hypothetical protein
MTLAEGSTTSFIFKEEATPYTQETGTGGTVLRRATGTLNLAKAEVTSGEKRTDFQEVNTNHGTEQVNFEIQSELFLGDYKAFWGSILRRDMTGISDITGSNYAISSGNLTSDGSDLISGGLFQGLIIRLASMTESAVNSRNIRITGPVAAGSAPVEAVDGGAALVDSAAAAATISVPGLLSYIPLTSHTRKTYTIERFDSRASVSRVGAGCVLGRASLAANVDQPLGLTFGGVGTKYVEGSLQVLTSPTAAGTGPAASSGIGYARIGGNVQQVITGLQLDVNIGAQTRGVIFTPTSPAVFLGRVAEVTGSIQVLKESNVLSSIFRDETETELEFFIAAPGTEPRAFLNVFMKRVKFNTADLDDPDSADVETIAFRALRPVSDVTGVQTTTILVQDSQAS